MILNAVSSRTKENRDIGSASMKNVGAHLANTVVSLQL